MRQLALIALALALVLSSVEVAATDSGTRFVTVVCKENVRPDGTCPLGKNLWGVRLTAVAISPTLKISNAPVEKVTCKSGVVEFSNAQTKGHPDLAIEVHRFTINRECRTTPKDPEIHHTHCSAEMQPWHPPVANLAHTDPGNGIVGLFGRKGSQAAHVECAPRKKPLLNCTYALTPGIFMVARVSGGEKPEVIADDLSLESPVSLNLGSKVECGTAASFSATYEVTRKRLWVGHIESR